MVFLQENVRTMTLISYIQNTKIPTLFYWIEAEKAFDRVEWDFFKYGLPQMYSGLFSPFFDQ